jgi:hypothetical protein
MIIIFLDFVDVIDVMAHFVVGHGVVLASFG